tara:strand:+ start:173 stop:889 length:717 start_codon:yes stop_codon:yes gene_type:complete
MISIDTVYQKVLNFASKEQRGYITPQEFNLFANQAQLEIFEQYFYDLNQARRKPNNETVYADADDILEAKLQQFEAVDGAAVVSGWVGAGGGGINKQVPGYVYRINRVELNQVKCEILNTTDFNDIHQGSPLLKPTNTRPVVNIRHGIMRCRADGSNLVTPTGVFYFRLPVSPMWNYFVVSGKALYNSNDSVDFELHPSEEVELVYKILKFAGVSMQRTDIMQAGQGMETMQVQQEKQ